jgi:hypothetical protein
MNTAPAYLIGRSRGVLLLSAKTKARRNDLLPTVKRQKAQALAGRRQKQCRRQMPQVGTFDVPGGDDPIEL